MNRNIHFGPRKRSSFGRRSTIVDGVGYWSVKREAISKLRRPFNCICLAALLTGQFANCIVAPVGDWSYKLGNGARVGRGPAVGIGNSPILNPDPLGTHHATVGGVEWLAYNETLIVGECVPGHGWFLVRMGPIPVTERFNDFEEWRKVVEREFPDYESRVIPGHGGILNKANWFGVISVSAIVVWILGWITLRGLILVTPRTIREPPADLPAVFRC